MLALVFGANTLPIIILIDPYSAEFGFVCVKGDIMGEYDKRPQLEDYIQSHKKWDDIHKLLPEGSFHKTHYEHYKDIVHCSVYNEGGGTIGHFALLFMPNTSGLVFSYGSWLLEEHQDKGIGRLLREIRDDTIDTFCYGILFCTVRADNAKQIHLLETMKWREVASYIDGCSCKEQLMYMRAGPGASIYA